MNRPRKNKYIISATISLVLSYTLFFVFDNNTIQFLGKEDGLFESAGAVFFLLSALCFLFTFLKIRKNTEQSRLRKIIFLLLGCLFVLAFFEEISWGQRIFNLTTPEFLSEINQQGEINIHNTKIFHYYQEDGTRNILRIDRLFNIFWFVFCCWLPLLSKFHGQIKKLFDRIGFPIVPISIGSFFMINYLLAKILSLQVDPMLLWPLSEIKEFNFAFFFFMISIWFLTNLERKTGLLHKHYNPSSKLL